MTDEQNNSKDFPSSDDASNPETLLAPEVPPNTEAVSAAETPPVAEPQTDSAQTDGAKKKRTQIIAAVLGIILIAGLAAGFFFQQKITATTMRLTRTKGSVGISDDAGKRIEPCEELGLYSGYDVETKPVSYAWFRLDEVKLAKMDESSEIGIEKEGNHLDVQIHSGGLFFNVTEPLADDESLYLRTSTMVVGIRGTCGWMEAGEDDASRIYILEGNVEASPENSTEKVSVSAGEMAELTVGENGEPEITVQPFAEEYVADFVMEELREDERLCAAILDASGLDVLNPPDPAERLRAEYEEIIAGRTLFDGFVQDGLDYAGYADLDGNGTEELILVTREASDFGYYDRSILQLEVYGESEGYAVKYGEQLFDSQVEYNAALDAAYEANNYDNMREYNLINKLFLYKNEYHTYLVMCRSIQDTDNWQYWGLENKKLILVDQYDYSPSDDTRKSYYEDWKLSDSECQDMFERLYQNERERDERISPSQLPENVCPRLSSDIRRKNVFLDCLKGNGYPPEITYAMLTDLNHDGTDDLLVLAENTGSDQSPEWLAFIWDGDKAHALNLTPHFMSDLEGDEYGYEYYARDEHGDEYYDYYSDLPNPDLVKQKDDRAQYENYDGGLLYYRYYWDGREVRSAIMEKENEYIGLDSSHLYREKTTGDIYILYSNEGRIPSDVFLSISDSVHYDFSSTVGMAPIDEEEYYLRELAREEHNRATQEAIDSRFEAIEIDHSPNDKYVYKTVEEVRQKLMER